MPKVFQVINHDGVVVGSVASQARRDRGVASVANAMRLIETLSAVPSIGVSELARQLGLSKPAVDRLLSTLMTSGYVEQTPETRKYRLTVKLVAISNSIKHRAGLIDTAHPSLVSLADQFHETVNLGILFQGSVTYADSIPSRQIFRIEPLLGSNQPAYCTAMGKVILAHRPHEEVERYLREFRPVPYTQHTPTTASDLRRRIAQASFDGFAIDDGELVEEIRCVAAPVLDHSGLALAAISITAIKSNFDRSKQQLTEGVVKAARTVSSSVTI